MEVDGELLKKEVKESSQISAVFEIYCMAFPIS